jgi:hypothetical protein
VSTPAALARPGAARLPAAGALAAAGRLAPWAGLPVAAALVTYAYSWAASNGDGATHFALFWLGMLAFVPLAAARLVRVETSRRERLGLLSATAFLFALPKFLRDPSGPIYADEIAHWRQSELLARTGDLYAQNPFISVVDAFPGLHALTLALHDLAGVTTWQAAVVLCVAFAVMGLAGVFMLAEELLGSARAGSVAALVYALNPSFMFFDMQYAYESMGIPLFVWSLVALARLQRPHADRAERLRWLALGVLLVAALGLTHHLTALFALGAVLFVLVATAHDRRRGGSSGILRLTAAYAVLAAAGAVGWLLTGGGDVLGYLGPHLTGGFDDLRSILEREEESRTLFAASTAPGYERVFAFVAPALAGVLAVVALAVLRRGRDVRPMLTGMIAYGLVYFPSVPFILSQSGAEGARRSWAFLYLGVSLLVAVGVLALVDRARRNRRSAGALALPAVAMVLLVGNVSAGLSVEYRFPGPYVFGSDARSLTPELRTVGSWFAETHGTGNRIIADRQSAIAVGVAGLNWNERAWSGFPVWEFLLQVKRPDREVWRSIEFLGTEYLIVDKRIPHELPRTGVYMVKDEPGGKAHTEPPPAAAIAKYARVPWATAIFESDDYVVYRLDPDALDLCTDVRPEPGVDASRCEAAP